MLWIQNNVIMNGYIENTLKTTICVQFGWFPEMQNTTADQKLNSYVHILHSIFQSAILEQILDRICTLIH